uniref:Pep_M12B_propep domain-containing protein n=1 Tax=Caenorhabditis tropicalis TaxID=1561998 RepID=A0A1I7UM41_9PELO
MSNFFTLLVVFCAVSQSAFAFVPFEYQLLDYTPVEFSFNQDLDDEPLTKCCTETANFNFRAYGRDFPLRLQRSCLIKEEFAEEAAQFSDEGTSWQGKLEDQPNSTVNGDIIDGLFEGIILTGDGEKFMVERQFQSDGKGHSLIYKVSSRKQIVKTLFPEQIMNDEGSGIEGSGLEIS